MSEIFDRMQQRGEQTQRSRQGLIDAGYTLPNGNDFQVWVHRGPSGDAQTLVEIEDRGREGKWIKRETDRGVEDFEKIHDTLNVGR